LSTAYRATNDRWYYVSGFGNELAEVNSLISDLGLELRTERDALDVAEYVLDLVGGGTEFQSSIVSDELSLQAAVSLDIVRRYGPAERTRRFDRWWATNTATRKAVHAPTAKRSATAFNVTFFRYVMEQVRQEQVTLDFRGNASGLSLQ
jgi:hypothetical protein